MIKKIIFDVDNTLLDTNKDCLDTYYEYFKNKEIAKLLYNVIGEYDEENRNYDKEDIVSYINSKIGFNFTMDDFNKIFEIYNNKATILNDEVEDVLKDLSSKYELVTLSKWYLNNQLERLKKAKLDKYFKNIYGFENATIKPSKSAFAIASANYNFDECLVIGDSIENDIIVPLEMGMDALYYNPNNIECDYNYINNLSEINKYLERRKKL